MKKVQVTGFEGRDSDFYGIFAVAARHQLFF